MTQLQRKVSSFDATCFDLKPFDQVDLLPYEPSWKSSGSIVYWNHINHLSNDREKKKNDQNPAIEPITSEKDDKKFHFHFIPRRLNVIKWEANTDVAKKKWREIQSISWKSNLYFPF